MDVPSNDCHFFIFIINKNGNSSPPFSHTWSSRCLYHTPLHYTHVFSPSGYQVAVIKQEVNIGDMTAMTAIHMTRSLRSERKKVKNKTSKIFSFSVYNVEKDNTETCWFLTLDWEQGNEKRRTFPKSSPVARSLFSLEVHTALMSVPSEPSGHKPEGKHTKIKSPNPRTNVHQIQSILRKGMNSAGILIDTLSTFSTVSSEAYLVDSWPTLLLHITDRNSPNTWKPSVQVKVAHGISRVVSTLTTCLHTEGIPGQTTTLPSKCLLYLFQPFPIIGII